MDAADLGVLVVRRLVQYLAQQHPHQPDIASQPQKAEVRGHICEGVVRGHVRLFGHIRRLDLVYHVLEIPPAESKHGVRFQSLPRNDEVLDPAHVGGRELIERQQSPDPLDDRQLGDADHRHYDHRQNQQRGYQPPAVAEVPDQGDEADGSARPHRAGERQHHHRRADNRAERCQHLLRPRQLHRQHIAEQQNQPDAGLIRGGVRLAGKCGDALHVSECPAPLHQQVLAAGEFIDPHRAGHHASHGQDDEGDPQPARCVGGLHPEEIESEDEGETQSVAD